MDFKDIMQVLSEFSELREDFLVEEIVSCSREIGKRLKSFTESRNINSESLQI